MASVAMLSGFSAGAQTPAAEGAVEEVLVPDITTVIGGQEQVVEGLPDFSVDLPPSLAGTGTLPPVPSAASSLPPSVLELASMGTDSRVFMEGMVAPAWPLSLLSEFSVYTVGESPFLLDFSYEAVGGYGLELAENGFFHNRSLLELKKTFSLGAGRVEVAGSYRAVDEGLQGQSILFDDINRRGANGWAAFSLPLGAGFSVWGELPLEWYTRYAGFSSTVGGTLANEGVAVSLLDVRPSVSLDWQGGSLPLASRNHLLSAGLQVDWSLASSLTPQPGVPSQRVGGLVRGGWVWSPGFRLEVRGEVGLVYLPSQVNKILVPFSLEIGWWQMLPESGRPLSAFLEGGLSSRRRHYLELEEREPFVNFTAGQLLEFGEESDWFASGGVSLPVVGGLSVELEGEYRQSAFGNGLLTGDYTAGIDGRTGLFSGMMQNRRDFSSVVAASMEGAGFLLRAGWLAHWLYVPYFLPPHSILVSVDYSGRGDRWGAGVSLDWGIGGSNPMPVVSAMGCFRPNEQIRLALWMQDMGMLFTGGQRILVAPYVQGGGSVGLSLQFKF